MYGPTHILAGMITRRTFVWRYFRGLAAFLTIVTALLLHGIFDKLGISTYHPAEAHFTDPFWLAYHVLVGLGTLVMLYMFWPDYKLGIIFSLIPDIDWLVIRTAHYFGQEVVFYKVPWMHNAINYFLDNVIPFSYLNMMPNQRDNPLACIWEILLFAILVLIYRAQVSYRRNIHF